MPLFAKKSFIVYWTCLERITPTKSKTPAPIPARATVLGQRGSETTIASFGAETMISNSADDAVVIRAATFSGLAASRV